MSAKGSFALADIGGTNARFAVLKNGRIGGVKSILTSNLDDPSKQLARWVSGIEDPVAGIALAVAGPVSGMRATLTNAKITIDGKHLARQMGLDAIILVNDLQAMAWAIPYLRTVDRRLLKTGRPVLNAPKVVVAPGTGLGVAGLISIPNRSGEGGWKALSGEGGHASIRVNDSMDDSHEQSWEDILAGRGLLNSFRQIGGKAGTPAAVTELCRKGDRRAQQAIGRWSEMLGAFCRDMTLVFGARGGCYIGGGLILALEREFDQAKFEKGFYGKKRMQNYLLPVPVWVIKHQEPALLGLKAMIDTQITGVE